MPEDSAEKKDFDVVVLRGQTDDGEGVKVLRVAGTSAEGEPRADRVEAGEVRPLKEGRPIAGEVVSLKPREGTPNVCDVDVALKLAAPAAKVGPAQVATSAYRESWDRIFGGGVVNRAVN